jgi:hypothetical protein
MRSPIASQVQLLTRVGYSMYRSEPEALDSHGALVVASLEAVYHEEELVVG